LRLQALSLHFQPTINLVEFSSFFQALINLLIRNSMLLPLTPPDDASRRFRALDLYPVLWLMPALFRLMLPEPRTRNRLAADLFVLRQDLFPMNRYNIAVSWVGVPAAMVPAGFERSECPPTCCRRRWGGAIAILDAAIWSDEKVRTPPKQKSPSRAVRLGMDTWASLPSIATGRCGGCSHWSTASRSQTLQRELVTPAIL
jgi:hypothetical protein